ncbi:MAG: ABC transporter permease [Candidatus Pacebacteria bacterium]|nr:ABC transporter permease [Candidatus Paceibacterota bacterium]
MIFQNIRRILRWGAIGFMRNGTVSFSSVLVMTIALLMIGSTMLMSTFLHATLDSVEDKIDINVYFSVDAVEEDMTELQRNLEYLATVESVTYVSKEEALVEFKARHENDELTIQALKELDENPLRARLNIKAFSPEQYDSIAAIFNEGSATLQEYDTGFIDKVNYRDNRLVIDRMTNIIDGVEKGGVVITFALILISVLITFNTIRLAIYISKEEIGVMRLVGAGKHYIRGPFIIEGVIYGVVSAIITVVLFYPITLTIKKHTEELFGGIDLFKYYVSNFMEIFLIILVSGIALGAVSSFLAVRKYLKK